MCEKRTENLLDKILITYPSENIFYSPSENNELKEIFKSGSKTGDKYGIPDRIYYNKNSKTICVFECKIRNIKKAKDDLKHYYSFMNKENLNHIYCIAFVGTTLNENLFHVTYNQNDIFPISLKFEDLLPCDDGLLKNNKNNNLNSNYKTMEDIKKIISWIHNCIRDNCNLSDSDKPILIIGILLAFTDDEFKNIFKNTNKHKNLSDIILSSLKKSINLYEQNITDNDLIDIIKEFNFIKIHESFKDNDILYTIVSKVYNEIIIKEFDCDIINIFYSEFVKYGNLDSKSLGIVLTPDYIVDLMVYLAKIKKDDIVLDLCTGTGSFLIESLKYNPLQIIGCEYQNKLFNLLKCNMILRNIKNCKLIKGDCFKNNFQATKSIINPPFGMKQDNKKELNFIIKQINSVKGIAVSIFPISCINNTKFISLKKEIMKKCKIETIINLNKEVFYGSASIQCCIMVVDTTKIHDIKNDKVLFINYENDGMEVVKHNGRQEKQDFNKILDNIKTVYDTRKNTNVSILTLLTPENDWNFHKFYINKQITLTNIDLKIKELDLNYTKNKLSILNEEKYIIKAQKTKFFRLDEIFNIESVKRITQHYAKSNSGIYPYISASDKDNGITSFINKFTHKSGVLTLANSGSVCSCFYQPKDFCGTDSIYILKFKNEEYINNEKISIYFASIIESQLKSKYSFGRALRKNKIDDGEGIILPSTNNDKIDFNYILEIMNF